MVDLCLRTGVGVVADELWQRVGQLVPYLAALAGLVALAVYVVARLRSVDGEDEPATSRMLTKFSEMREQGELSEEEYRTIKTRLATQLRRELKDSDDKG